MTKDQPKEKDKEKDSIKVDEKNLTTASGFIDKKIA